jgi:hypothetical protein
MHALSQDAKPWSQVVFHVFVNVVDLLREKKYMIHYPNKNQYAF